MKTNFKTILLGALMCFAGVQMVCAATGDKHRLTFDPNGGTTTKGGNFALTKYVVGIDANGCGYVTVQEGSDIFNAMVDNKPTRDGYSFMGWYTDKSAGTKVYTNEGKCVNGTDYWDNSKWKYNGDVTVYAHWHDKTMDTDTYTLTFDPNGGEVKAENKNNFTSPSNIKSGVVDGKGFVTVKTNISWFYSMSNCLPTRTGYTFLGWYTAADGGEKVYDATGTFVVGPYWNSDQTCRLTNEMTVYAHWSENTIGLNGNAASEGNNLIAPISKTCANLVLTDATPMTQTSVTEFTATAASYTRTMANEWGTMCLPFAIVASENANYTFFTISGVNSNELTLTSISGTIEAGTPVIVRKGAGASNLTINATNAAAKSSTTTAGTGFTMKGTFVATTIEGSDQWYISNNAFWPATKGEVTVAPYRAWLEGSASGARLAISIFDDEEATAIQTVNALISEDAQFFDANGRKLSSAKKGINIIKTADGKSRKVIIK